MVYLVLSIVCSTGIALLLKYGEQKNRDRLTVITFNYVVAVVMSLAFSVAEGAFGAVGAGTEQFIHAFFVWLPASPVSSSVSMAWAVKVGILGGLAYFGGFMMYLRGIRSSGVAPTGAIARIAIVIPLLVAVIIWNERPDIHQWVGIIIAFLSILVAQLSISDVKKLRHVRTTLLLVFLLVGTGELANKLFQQYGLVQHKSLFLLTVFGTALLVSLVFLIRRFRPVRLSDASLGLIVGVPNMLTSYFLIRSFASVPASVAFPVYGAETIVLIALGGRFIFAETLRKREWTAIALAAAAVVLMSWS